MSELNVKNNTAAAQNAAEEPAMLEVKDLHTSFFTDSGEVQAVNGVNFRLEKERSSA